MARILALIAMSLVIGFGLAAAPARAQTDPATAQAVKDGSSPDAWFKGQQQAKDNSNWDVTSKISPAMAQILSQALVDFGSYDPKGRCEGAGASQAWQALADAANACPLEGFLDAIKRSLSGIKDVATFGADPSAAADILDAHEAMNQAFEKAKSEGEDWLKERLKQIWQGKKIEVLQRTETRGVCTTTLVAIWDEGAGTYKIVIYGDCNCAPVSGWALGSASTLLKTFAVTLTGTVTPSLRGGKGVFIVGFPRISVVANCGCSAKGQTSTAGGSGGGLTTPGGGTTGGGDEPPTTREGWAKVTTKCRECQPIVDKIHAAEDARDQMDNAFREAQDAVNMAKRVLDDAPASEKAAAQANYDAAVAAENALTAREAGLILLQKQLWAQLKACEKACGHASSGYCPPQDGEYAMMDPKDRMAVEVLADINAARADPHAYAVSLQRFEANYHGKLVTEPGHPPAMTTEGAPALEDAVAYLDHRAPSPALADNCPLTQAAQRLIDDAGPRGGVSHTASDGSTMTVRIRQAGVWAAAMEEDISLAARTPEAVVRQLVIDDGVPTRGHRTALFDPHLSIAGVACGPHATYGWMCVVDFAGALMPAPGSEVVAP